MTKQLLLFLCCTLVWFYSKAQEAWIESKLSPKLKQFMADHQAAAKILDSSFSEVFSNRSLGVFYFYSTNEKEARACHYYPHSAGAPEVVICIRENQHPLDEFITLVFETLNAKGEGRFAKLAEDARLGSISREDFVSGILKVEFEATKRTRELLLGLKFAKKDIAASHYYKMYADCPVEFEDFLPYTKRVSRDRDVFKEYEAEYDTLRAMR